MKIKYLLILAVATMLMASCNSKSDHKTGDLSGSIAIDGSSTVYPVTEAVAEEFRAEFPDVKITIGISGTGGGFKKFARGETDISNASRPIREEEIQLCKDNGISYIGLEVAYDGMAVVVNPRNTWLTEITVADLKKIWEPSAQDKIKRWNQIRPEWPDEEIHLFGPGTASGTYDYFTEAIVGKSGSSRGDFTASEDDNVLVQGIKNDKYALGFFGLAYYEENHESLKLVAVNSGSGPVLPSKETVLSGEYKPLSRSIYIYVNEKAVSRPEVVGFVDFYLSNVKALAGEVGYIPLQDSTYESVKQRFADFVKLHGAQDGQK
ncbi:MAG TPA: PstS family phosphate ABC transporter substrate-binding protein [Bacteroidales bacterium]|nr:PstS family phosphate ABC transporter substrate-binding protein [Bacteroidales bacterium]HRZ49222.1 PstS family phosphate ABC transporter substrate-binding protein [Bacteroidales bacterium]